VRRLLAASAPDSLLLAARRRHALVEALVDAPLPAGP
jgi:hypothetical protein